MAKKVALLTTTTDLGNLVATAADVLGTIEVTSSNETVLTGSGETNATVANVTTVLTSSMTLLKGLADAANFSAAEAKLSVEASMNLMKQFMDVKFDDTWASVSETTKEPIDSPIRYISNVLANTALQMSANCSDPSSFKNEVSVIQAIRMTQDCQEKGSQLSVDVSLTGGSKQVNVTEKLDLDNFKPKNSENSVVQLSPRALNGTNSSEVVGFTVYAVKASSANRTAGGLPVRNLTAKVLASNINHVALPNGMVVGVQNIRRKPKSLAIQSAVVTIDAVPSSALKIDLMDMSTWINFTVALQPANMPEDINLWRTQARKKWAAVATMNALQNGTASDDLELSQSVQCVSWSSKVLADGSELPANSTNITASQLGAWTVEGCYVLRATVTHVTCSCSHLTTFAIAMEPIDGPGRDPPFWMLNGAPTPEWHAEAQRLITLVGNGTSVGFLGLFMILLLTKNCKSMYCERYWLHFNFAVALLLHHVWALLLDLFEANQLGCQGLGIAWNFIQLSIYSWLARECSFMFHAYVKGRTNRSMLRHLVFGWVVPAVAVAACAGATSMQHYGQDVMCMLAREHLTAWVMWGLVLLLAFVSFWYTCIVTCNLETPAYMIPELILSLQFQIWQQWRVAMYQLLLAILACVVLYAPFVYSIYIYLVLSSLQGFVAVYCFGVNDEELWVMLFERKFDRFKEDHSARKVLLGHIQDDEGTSYLRSVFEDSGNIRPFMQSPSMTDRFTVPSHFLNASSKEEFERDF